MATLPLKNWIVWILLLPATFVVGTVAGMFVSSTNARRPNRPAVLDEIANHGLLTAQRLISNAQGAVIYRNLDLDISEDISQICCYRDDKELLQRFKELASSLHSPKLKLNSGAGGSYADATSCILVSDHEVPIVFDVVSANSIRVTIAVEGVCFECTAELSRLTHDIDRVIRQGDCRNVSSK